MFQISNDRSLICHCCWTKADRSARRFVSRPSGSSIILIKPETSEHESEPIVSSQPTPVTCEAIALPNYRRGKDTESHCFIEGCRRKERNRIPDTIRKMLLLQYNFYIPKNNRICNSHLNTESWDFLRETRDNYVKVFTAVHIQDMLDLSKCCFRFNHRRN